MRRPFEPDPGHAGEGTGMLQDFSPIRDIAHADVIGAGIAGTWQALALAKAGLDVTVYERDDAAMTRGGEPRRRRHARAVVRGRSVGAGHHPARRPLARALARGAPRHAVQRLAGGGASARPRRLRPLREADRRPPAARRPSHRQSRTRARRPVRRRAVLSRRRPCRAAPRAAAAARAACGARRRGPLRNRTPRKRRHPPHRRLPRPCRARQPRPSCAASRAR